MYKTNENEWIKHLDFMIMDQLALQLAFILSYWLLYWYAGKPDTAFYLFQACILSMLQLIISLLLQPYSHIIKRGNAEEMHSALNMTAVILTLDVIFLFIVKQSHIISRVFLFVMAVLTVVLTWAIRTVYKKHLRIKKRRTEPNGALIIFTYSHLAEEAVKGFLKDTYNGYKINGVYLLDKGMPGRREIHGIPVIDRKTSLFDAIGREWVDEAFFLLSPDHVLPRCYIDTLLKMGITIHYSYPSFFEDQDIMQKTDKIGSYYVFTNSLKIVNSTSLAVKRLIDIIGGLVGCILTAIIFIF
ncbi:MAG: hypothetical protein E7221_08500, partial [Clostridiales bacterium]|nr:hypothetical protein [Clostridiales bacterium]